MSYMTAAVSSSSFKATRPSSESPSDLRQKTRDVASRYLGTSSFSSSSFLQSSQRCQSPSVTRRIQPVTPSSTNRLNSTGRRQSVTPRRGLLDRQSSGEVSAAQRMLLTSGRSLFASVQAELFTGHENRSKSPITAGRGPVDKSKTTAIATSRSCGAQQQKPKLTEQWPRSLQPSSLSRSVDFTDTRKKSSRSGNSVAKTLQNSSNTDLEKVDSSTAKARYSQLTTNRLRHQLEPDSSIAKSNGLRKISVDSPSTTRTQLFPKREQIRPASPSKFGITAVPSSPKGSSIARGISPSRDVIHPRGVSPSSRLSPLRVRSSLSNNTNTPLILNLAKKEKIRDNGVADAHLLRLFHNRLLHWRFVNARANAVISAQKMKAEKRLYNSWICISKLYESAIAKRIEIQNLKQNLKLLYVLNKQITHLEEWYVMDRDYTGSLVGAAEAFKCRTLCLPVNCKVNIESVKEAICSAVDVMQAMASSICLLLPKVGKISYLAAELSRVNVKEQRMLDLCRDLLNTISSHHVTECSLRTQALQLPY